MKRITGLFLKKFMLERQINELYVSKKQVEKEIEEEYEQLKIYARTGKTIDGLEGDDLSAYLF